jgi:hypothetical protein
MRVLKIVQAFGIAGVLLAVSLACEAQYQAGRMLRALKDALREREEC